MTKKRKPKTLADAVRKAEQGRADRKQKLIDADNAYAQRMNQIDAMRDRRTPRYEVQAAADVAKYIGCTVQSNEPQEPRVEATVEDVAREMAETKKEYIQRKLDEAVTFSQRATRDPSLEIPMPADIRKPMKTINLPPATGDGQEYTILNNSAEPIRVMTTPYVVYRQPSRLPHYLLGILIGFGMCLVSWPWVKKIWMWVAL